MKLELLHTFSKRIPDSGLGSLLKLQTPSFIQNHPYWDPDERFYKKGGEKKIGIELDNLTKLQDDSIRFYFFSKYDLLSYLTNAREEFLLPTQEYINKKFLPEIFGELFEKTAGLDEDIFIFNAIAKKDGDNARAYIQFANREDTKIYSNLIDICLSGVSDMEFNIIEDVDSKNKFINIKPIYNMKPTIERLNDILENTLVSDEDKLYYFIFKFGNSIKELGGITIFNSNQTYQEHKEQIDAAYNVFISLIKENINIEFNYPSAIDTLKEYLDNHQEKPLQQILFGAPGTGKSHTINKHNDITEQNSIRTTFHPDSDYSTFVGCYKPTKDEESGEITYDFTPQAFTNAYVAAWKNVESPFFLIIEEINRGNCAQIFGDIFQLLDRDPNGFSSYKTTPDQDLANYIREQFTDTDIDDADVKSGKKMQLPPNLYIWATMNTSDQSLFPIDSAFKRRWDWRYIPIDYTDKGHYIACGDTQYSWADFLQKVNDKVESVTQSEDKKLGYWFMGNGAEQKEITVDRFVSKVVFYLWNDVFKDFGKSGNTIFKDTFAKFHKFFDFGGNPKEDVVKAFLDALGVKSGHVEAGIPEAETPSNAIDYTKYSFDGEKKLSKKALGEKIVLKYLKQNPNLSFEQIRNIFTFDNSVETPYQYKGIIAKTEDITDERAYSAEQTSSDGVKYKILTWWNKYNVNFIIKFAEAQGWSITEEQK